MTAVRLAASATFVLTATLFVSTAEAQRAPNQRFDTYQEAPGDQYQPTGPIKVAQNGLPQSQPGSPLRPGEAPPNQPKPPFVLTPQQQAEVAKVLGDWEKKSSATPSFEYTFTRWEYDLVFFPAKPGQEPLPKSIRTGEIAYTAPDKGLIEEKEAKTWKQNAETKKWEFIKVPTVDHWICDGKSIYQVNHETQEIKEIAVPQELQGKAISQGPLPFVFNAKADELLKRYYIRLITPEDVAKQQTWLQIMPRYQRDAANFSEIQVILRAADMFPLAVKIIDPGQNNRDVYQFAEKKSFPGSSIFQGRPFAPPSGFGWKIVHETVPGAPAAASPQGQTPQAKAPQIGGPARK